MAISFVNAGAIAGGGSSCVPGLPVDIADNDVLLLLVETANENITLPAGWQTLATPGIGTAADVAATRLLAFWRKYHVDAYNGQTINSPGNNHVAAVMLAYRDVEYVGLCYDQIASDTGASDTAVTFPAVTTGVANCVIVNAVSWSTDSTAAQASGWTNGNLGSLTERFDAGVISGNGGGFSVADGTLASAGSSGSTTATLGAASVQARLTLALRPLGTYAGHPSTPTVASVTHGGTTTNTTTHSIVLPSTVLAGEVLCVAMAVDGMPTITWDNSTAGTWVEKANTNDGGTDGRLAVYTKTADGTEDGLTLSITTSAGEQSSWAVFRIQGVTGDIEITATTSSAGANTLHTRSNETLTPSWGAAATLWLGITARAALTAPANKPPMWNTGSTYASTGAAGSVIDYGWMPFNIASMEWGGQAQTSANQFVAMLLAFEPAASGAPAAILDQPVRPFLHLLLR